MNAMKKRWISLFVENDVGVLAKISGLFSGKSYNLESLTVGTTEDPTMSRITIGLNSDDLTFEQIKKQLNRCVEVVKVIDFTNVPTHMKEILFIKIKNCTKEDKDEIFQITNVFHASITDYGVDSILLESVQSESRNDDIIRLLTNRFKQIEVVRGGSVAIESISITDR
jgi:acetolactate synthase-1/3 small subunit